MSASSSTPPDEALPASALPLPHEVLVWRGMKATPTVVLIDAFVVGDQLEKALIEETARRRRAEVLLFATQQAYVREHEAVVQSETASRLPPEANELARMAANDRRYRRLADAAGRTWDKLAGAHLMGQLDSAIDHLGDDE